MLAPFTDPTFEALGGLAHAVTTRAGGVSRAAYATLNVGLGSEDSRECVEENRRRVARHLGFAHLITPYQVHGRHVAVVETTSPSRPRCDAMITDRQDVLLGVLGADCPGVLLVDPARHALAVVHAGWRGVAQGVVRAAIESLCTRYGSRAHDLHALIGPGIGMPRYEVDDDVIDGIRRSLPAATDLHAAGVCKPTRPGHAVLSLARALTIQLTAQGVAPGCVRTMEMCTFDEAAHFYSYRRDGARSGRHALVAGWIE